MLTRSIIGPTERYGYIQSYSEDDLALVAKLYHHGCFERSHTDNFPTKTGVFLLYHDATTGINRLKFMASTKEQPYCQLSADMPEKGCLSCIFVHVLLSTECCSSVGSELCVFWVVISHKNYIRTKRHRSHTHINEYRKSYTFGTLRWQRSTSNCMVLFASLRVSSSGTAISLLLYVSAQYGLKACHSYQPFVCFFNKHISFVCHL